MHKALLTALTAMLVSFPANAQSFDLVCDGHITDEGVSEFVFQSFPPSISGVLLQFRDDEVIISGDYELAGAYELLERTDATYSFISQDTLIGGELNRFSGRLYMAQCATDECDTVTFVFQANCSRQEPRF